MLYVLQVTKIRRLLPVLEVADVGDEGRVVEVLLRGQVLEVQRVAEALDELCVG